jgi:pyruvate-ferredoxin/flavodoxin oxidoreductase
MGIAMAEEKKAVDAGYWNLFRFNPSAEKKFTLDSKAATVAYADFIGGEARYTALSKVNKEKAGELFKAAEENAKEHFEHLQSLVNLYDKKD